MSNRQAPEGHIWVCAACGKTADWAYGFDEHQKNAAMQGWDESCATWAHLVRLEDVAERSEGGRILKLKPGAKAVHWLECK